MKRICPRCRTVYSYSSKECPLGCNKKNKRESNKVYDKCQREHKDFYDSLAWKKLREACKNRFSGICIWTLYKHKRMVKGKIAHHIVPVEIKKELALNIDNLLYVSDEAHREIHMRMDTSSAKDFGLLNKSILEEIGAYIKRWHEEDEGVGV